MSALLAVEDVLRHVMMWSGHAVSCSRPTGGLSHQIWRVDVDEAEICVLRVLEPAVSTAGLGVPPTQKIDNTLRAAREAADKWGQAVRDLDAPDLGALIATAAGRPVNSYS